jgi:cytochrome c oxidase subunit 2
MLTTLLTACGGKAVDPADIGDPERGRVIFETGAELTTQVCSNCHSVDGSTIEGIPAPSLQGIGESAGERVKGLSAVEYLRESILDSDAYIMEGYSDMMDPSYKYLFSEDDINDLIAYMLTQ